jgi:hypothetical protein
MTGRKFFVASYENRAAALLSPLALDKIGQLINKLIRSLGSLIDGVLR